MTSTTATKKLRPTASEKRAAEIERSRIEQARAGERRQYEEASAKLFADNANFIRELSDKMVSVAATCINHIFTSYKPRTEFRVEARCAGYDYGFTVYDRMHNTITAYASVEFKFQINHSCCGSMPTSSLREFTSTLNDLAQLTDELREKMGDLVGIYEATNRSRRDETTETMAIDSRLLRAASELAQPRIFEYLRLRKAV